MARHCSATFSLDKNRIKNELLAKLNEILPTALYEDVLSFFIKFLFNICTDC